MGNFNNFVSNNKGAIVVGGIGAAASIFAFKWGKARGHKKGMEEGTAKQAKRDAKKLEEMERNHQQDRQRWKEQDRRKDDFINDLMDH